MQTSLCATCQRARKDCDQYDRPADQPTGWCDDYRAWTPQALHDAQCAAARKTGSAGWHELCRLIEIENRYLTESAA